MGNKGVPIASSISQRQAERIGGCGPLVWLWDPGMQWIGGILQSLASMVRITGGLIHSQTNTWGITKALTIGRDRFLLRIGANNGVISTGDVESLGKIGLALITT